MTLPAGSFFHLLVSDAVLTPRFTSAFFFSFFLAFNEKGSVSEFLPGKKNLVTTRALTVRGRRLPVKADAGQSGRRSKRTPLTWQRPSQANAAALAPLHLHVKHPLGLELVQPYWL